MTKSYFVCIMTNASRTLYTGVTSDLRRRVFEHATGVVPGFTRRYGIKRLVYYEQTSNVLAAIAREKEIKGWLRARKIALVESANPNWQDLSTEWRDPDDGSARDNRGRDSSRCSE